MQQCTTGCNEVRDKLVQQGRCCHTGATTEWDGWCNYGWCNETDRQVGIQWNGTDVATMAGATRLIVDS